jgi:hypothetical protein
MEVQMVDGSFSMSVTADADKLSDPSYLRALCQNEVDRFNEYLRATDPQFKDGLAKFEKLAIEGYLYQKAKGHIDAFHQPRAGSMER